jgi:hypothetical protein
MCERLPHYVKIDILGKTRKLVANQIEFFETHSAVISHGPGTEGAIAITNISYFNVDS